MERVKQVLEERAADVAAHLVLRQDFGRDVARRFVEVAGAELIASWEWQASSLELEDLATWTNVQRLLGGIHAKALASELDLSPTVVWHALRTFVPRVLLLASRPESVPARGSMRSRPRPRRAHVDSGGASTGFGDGWSIGRPSPAVSPS